MTTSATNHWDRLARLFIWTSLFVLAITGVSKLVSVAMYWGVPKHFGSMPDPILGLSFNTVFLLGGLLELAAVAACIRARRQMPQLLIIAFVSTLIAIYRFGLWILDYQRPCSCLGSMTDIFQIDSRHADVALKWILVLVVVGSYALATSRFLKERNTGIAH